MVYKCLLEVGSTVPPVLLQVKSQVAGGHLPRPVADVASGEEISLNSIDDRHASHSLPPLLDQVGIGSPSGVLPSSVAILVEDVVSELVGPVVPEVSPQQLSDEVLRVLIWSVFFFPSLDLPVDVAGRKAPVGHPRTELG